MRTRLACRVQTVYSLWVLEEMFVICGFRFSAFRANFCRFVVHIKIISLIYMYVNANLLPVPPHLHVATLSFREDRTSRQCVEGGGAPLVDPALHDQLPEDVDVYLFANPK